MTITMQPIFNRTRIKFFRKIGLERIFHKIRDKEKRKGKDKKKS
tara:strand:+ start:584 stop:715 length:132 start_codon:yes stop_codon:yes gene_type:complete